jgi:hypothetical protein
MRTSIIVVALALGMVGAAGAQPSALKIVVLEGEGAVNIIQQKTAVRPLIEVRDRNNLPVAGASVTFTIGGGAPGAAFAGGAQTITVTTNAAGQAAASGLNAVSSGAFKIEVHAAFQGQVATAAISQTNFASAAAAGQAAAGAGSGSTAGVSGGATGAAGGGGISATTIGIVGAAVAGGAVAATQVAGKSDSNDVDSANTYNGTLGGQIVFTQLSTNAQGQVSACARTRTIGGTIRIQLNSANTSGTASLQMTQTEIAFSGGCGPAPGDSLNLENLAVSGGPGALAFNGTSQSAGGTNTTFTFGGTLSGNTITGTMSVNIQATANGPNQPTGSGATTLTVTLQK